VVVVENVGFTDIVPKFSLWHICQTFQNFTVVLKWWQNGRGHFFR